jgi:hypothetical protein
MMPVARRAHGLIAVALVLASMLAQSGTARTGGQTIVVGKDELAGVVRGPSGPEAGVWVIAETTELPTRFARIVVTDDEGRYLMPGLPPVRYSVWVRGYGLVDSPKVEARPGAALDLGAVVAPSLRAAAEYYPAGYWWSLLQVPDASEFPGTGPSGNGIAPNMRSQAEWLRVLKSGGCWACHALGTKATREIPKGLGEFASSVHAWERRLQSGQAGANMITGLNQLGRERALAVFADWTDRIAAGALPPAPPRPRGIERNVVITMWDWADPKAYLHDLVGTDRRDPTVNANGPLYGALELAADYVPVLDPVGHEAGRIPLTVRDPATPPPSPKMPAPSPYWGDEAIWTSRANVHNPMLDERGRLWLTRRAAARQPRLLQGRLDTPLGQAVSAPAVEPPPRDVRPGHRAVEPHQHLLRHAPPHVRRGRESHAVDERRRTGRGLAEPQDVGRDRRRGEVAGLDGRHPGHQRQREARRVRRARPARRSLERQALRRGLLCRGPGARRVRVGQRARVPRRRHSFGPGVEPAGDGARRGVRTAVRRSETRRLLASRRRRRQERRVLGGARVRAPGQLRPPEVQGAAQRSDGHGPALPRGVDALSGAAPADAGVHAPGSAEGSYYTWVDQFDTSGLGPNTPINTGNGSEALLALKDGQWVVLRVPYPLGFYTKWVDGRIDDPEGGWKGRALWATISTRTPFHMEGGMGTTSKVYKLQIRPDPLAR